MKEVIGSLNTHLCLSKYWIIVAAGLWFSTFGYFIKALISHKKSQD